MGTEMLPLLTERKLMRKQKLSTGIPRLARLVHP